MSWLRGFDLRSLEVFITVAESGSMAEAARRLGVTQSAVSQQIRATEDLFHTQLLDRNLRPMRLTPAGQVLRDGAARILRHAEQTRHNVMAAGGSTQLELRMAVVDSLAGPLVPALVPAIRAQLPSSNVVVRSGLSMDQGQALLKREIEVLIANDPLDDIDNLERHTLLHEPFVLLLPASLSVPTTDLESLVARLPLMRYGRRSTIGRQVEVHLRRLRLEIPHSAEFDATASIASIVAQGLGFAITTPVCLLDGALHDPRLRCVPLPCAPLQRTITLISRRGELGDTAASLARLSRDVFRNRCLPVIAKALPWAAAQIDIPSP